MHKILTFPDHLRLINERSTAFRAAVAAAPSLDLRVPTHPERTLFDLVQHVGMGRRKQPPSSPRGPRTLRQTSPHGMTARVRLGNARLSWPGGPSPSSSCRACCARPARIAVVGRGGVTRRRRRPPVPGRRRQLHEIAVHTYDAQLAVGAAQPLPEEVALDGFDDFQFTLLRHDGRLAARARRRRLPRHRGPLLAPSAFRRRRTGPPASARPLPARTRTRPTPPPGARPVTWS